MFLLATSVPALSVRRGRKNLTNHCPAKLLIIS